MQYSDLWTVGSLAIAVITAAFLIIQTRKYAKVASADLSMRMIEVVRRDDFRKILHKIRDGESEKLHENEIGKVLNHYEYLAGFEKDGVVTFNQVLHQHGRNIKMLYNDPTVKRIFNESRKKDPKYNYVNLDKLFVRIDNKIAN